MAFTINEESVNFFKEEAQKEGIPYQRLIRKVVDLYAQHHQSMRLITNRCEVVQLN